MQFAAQAAAQPVAPPLLPPGLSAWITPEIVADTLQTFQPFYDTSLTVDEAVEILLSAGRLLAILNTDNAKAKGEGNEAAKTPEASIRAA